MEFDIETTDQLLSTTRAVRKRLDFSRPVPRDIITRCLELAVQAPTGGNQQGWRWLVIDDADKRAALADLYRKGGNEYLAGYASQDLDQQTTRVFSSAQYLADHLQEAPVHLIPCMPRPEEGTPLVGIGSAFGSIYPAVWSFQLALRARGLGSALTTLHLIHEKEAAELLGIPDDLMQVALLPVAYTKGTDFKPANRPPIENIIHWNEW